MLEQQPERNVSPAFSPVFSSESRADKSHKVSLSLIASGQVHGALPPGAPGEVRHHWRHSEESRGSDHSESQSAVTAGFSCKGTACHFTQALLPRVVSLHQ